MLYNKTIMSHFTRPRNQGSIKNADGVGEAGNPVCGDIMKIYLKIKKQGKKEIISNIKFETLGCATAIANSSVLTEMAKGKEISQALKIGKPELIKALGGDVPKIKIHCSFLAQEALKKAVEDYKSKVHSPESTAKKESNKTRLRYATARQAKNYKIIN